jgi:pyrroloquinoline quinone (PQQ) biosynthesis protein C
MANLADEEGDPIAHVDLFEIFAAAVGAEESPATPATVRLLGAYGEARDAGPVSALAGLLAYEKQSPGIASSKAEGLRRHYGLADADVRFWDHHSTVDVDHAAWTVDALTALDATPEVVLDAARTVAEAWWGFLDEREAAAPAA